MALTSFPTARPITLRAIKIAHTVIWAFFAGCIIAIPVLAWRGHFKGAAGMSAVVLIEVVILTANRMVCPLTVVARQLSDDPRDNFDIYLPQWLARHNKLIFGILYVAGMLFTAWRWSSARG